MKFEEIKKGVVKRTQRRSLGLFIDGTGLDRATRRIKRKVDIPNLVRGVTSGLPPAVARYYTLIPYEDDSRQLAFLDAISKAGLQVIVKRLPPKGITRQVTVDSLMASDIVAFALGHSQFSTLSEYTLAGSDTTTGESKNKTNKGPLSLQLGKPSVHSSDTQDTSQTATSKTEDELAENESTPKDTSDKDNMKRIVTVVCPSRELAYPLSLIGELGVDTVSADFSQFNSGDILKSAAKWIDLSDSETIWRE